MRERIELDSMPVGVIIVTEDMIIVGTKEDKTEKKTLPSFSFISKGICSSSNEDCIRMNADCENFMHV